MNRIEPRIYNVLELNLLVLKTSEEVWNLIYSRSLAMNISQRWLFAARVVNFVAMNLYGWIIKEPVNNFQKELKPMDLKKPKRKRTRREGK